MHHHPWFFGIAGVTLVCIGSLAGCAAQPRNPSFAVEVQQGRDDLERMYENRRPLQRPLVVVGGFLDPGVAAFVMEVEFSNITNDRRIVGVALGECTSFEQCRRKIVAAVEENWPSRKGEETVEVDVVGLSMGGVAARYAALPAGKEKHLNIARLFTISSPLRGAEEAARLPLLHPLQKSLRPGSPLYARLNGEPSAYPIVSYVRLGDRVIGESNSATPDQTPYWLPNEPMSPAHGGAFLDARILADISRRLRGETPWAHAPAAPLPRRSGLFT